MRLTFCGVRGSTPSPGAEFVRYGGHTSCVALAHDGHPPSLVLDAGTGLRGLAKQLDGPFRGTIVLGHMHWDHTQGLPFFSAARCPGADLMVLVPAQDVDPTSLLSRAMSPPHFPIAPTEIPSWRVDDLDAGTSEFDGWSVTALDIPHGGGRTFGLRVSDGATIVAYLSDHCPTDLGPGPNGVGAYHEAALQLAAGVDLLVHDAQLVAAEVPERAAFGHAAAEYAVGLAEAAGAARVALFHHDPDRTDEQIDAIVARFTNAAVPVFAAAQGDVVTLGR